MSISLRRWRLPLMAMTAGCWFALPLPLAADPPNPPNPPATRPTPYAVPPGKPAFDRGGAQVGEQLPDLTLFTPEGDGRELYSLLASRQPTLLLTASYTCPKSRSTYPAAAELARRFKGKIEVRVLYVVEAHPQHDPSPYTGAEDLTADNRRDGILRRQPKTFEQRLKLCEEFQSRLDVKLDLALDGMDNRAWQALGGGPNMAVLVNDRGVVLARQGWFDADAMAGQIEAFLRVAADAANSLPPPLVGEDLLKQMSMDEWDVTAPFANGDVAKAVRLLDQYPQLVRWVSPLDPRGHFGDRTLLQEAAARGQAAIVELLLKRGADVNVQTPHAAAALHLAAERGDLKLIDLLLAAGADVNRKADVGEGLTPTGRLLTGPTPLQEAMVHGHLDAAKRLTAAGATGNFFTAAGLGDVPTLERHLKADPTLATRPDGLGRPPLFYAAGAGSKEATTFLLAHGATLDRPRDGRQPLPLHWAIEQNQPAIVSLLLEAGADPNAAGYWDQTPLHLALHAKSPDCIKLLLARHADPSRPDLNGWMPLHLAAILDRPEMIDLLIAGGASPKAYTTPDHAPCAAPSSHLETPLHFAARSGPIEAVRRLLAAGADVNAEDSDGHTPLDAATAAKDPARAAVQEVLRTHGGKPGSGHPRISESGPLNVGTPLTAYKFTNNPLRRAPAADGSNGK